MLRINLVKLSLKLSDHIIAVSSRDKKFISNNYNIPSNKISFIPNGVSEEYFNYKKGKVEDGEIKLLFVGTWYSVKGVYYLKEAYKKLIKRYPKIHLSLIGTNRPKEDILVEFPREMWDTIDVIPSISQDDLILEYTEHDMFILPSLSEGMPLSLLESMSIGLPIVASNVSGIADVVEDGKNGFLVPPRDVEGLVKVISTLIEDANLRKKMGQRGREKMSDYTWDKIADRTIRVYEEVLRSKDQ